MNRQPRDESDIVELARAVVEELWDVNADGLPVGEGDTRHDLNRALLVAILNMA